MIREYAEVKYRRRRDPYQSRQKESTKIKLLHSRGLGVLLREIERHGHDLLSIHRLTEDEYLSRKNELTLKKKAVQH
ncbi:hypothetical protein X546_15665 [Brevibacillus borstelensis cifa_chp40]|nr:hypothetical protein X546_15665 [Brevibacillus borstelensis cifa_chp40]